MSIIDIEIEFQKVDSITEGGFRRPALKARLEDVDYDALLKSVGIDETLDVIGEQDVINWLCVRGYSCEAQEA